MCTVCELCATHSSKYYAGTYVHTPYFNYDLMLTDTYNTHLLPLFRHLSANLQFQRYLEGKCYLLYKNKDQRNQQQ